MSGSTFRQAARSRETEEAVAGFYRDRGWPGARRVEAFRPGADVIGLPGLDCEVKARRDFHMTGWLNQRHDPVAAERLAANLEADAAGDVEWELPSLFYVVLRPDGYGPAKVAGWPVIMRLDQHTALLRGAGYGSR